MSLQDIKYFVSGQLGQKDFQIDYFLNNKNISPWNDISLRIEDLFNMVVEIPTFSRDKIEMSKQHPFNSLKYDLKNNQPRMYHGPIYWNYGFIPQTWENPDLKEFDCGGDDDPLDVIEIGGSLLDRGSIHQVRVLGCLAMIDRDEYDWKIIALNKNDKYFDNIHHIHDIHKYYPNTLSGILEWFRWYKYPDNRKLNIFELEEKFQDSDFAQNIIKKTHQQWFLKNKGLIK